MTPNCVVDVKVGQLYDIVGAKLGKLYGVVVVVDVNMGYLYASNTVSATIVNIDGAVMAKVGSL